MISSVSVKSERQEWTLQTPTEDCNDNNALFFRVQMSAFDTPSLYSLHTSFVKSIMRRNGDVYFCAHYFLPALQKKNNLLTLTLTYVLM